MLCWQLHLDRITAGGETSAKARKLMHRIKEAEVESAMAAEEGAK